jgi:hypothetical protein
MLTFYFGFLFTQKAYYHRDRILCMAMFLFNVQEKNKLNQEGILKRFSIECYGKQPALEDIRAEKTSMFKELADKRGTREYDEWFLKYNPNVSRKEPETSKSARRKTPDNVFIETPNEKEAAAKAHKPKSKSKTQKVKKPSSKPRTPKKKILKHKKGFVF